MVEKVDAAVVEPVRPPPAGRVDGKHVPIPGERRQDRHPLVGAVPDSEQQQRCPGSELEHLSLALRPAHLTDARVGCVTREQSRLCLLELSIQPGLQ